MQELSPTAHPESEKLPCAQRGSKQETPRAVPEAEVSSSGNGCGKQTWQKHCVQTRSLPVSSVSATRCGRGVPMLKWMRYSELKSSFPTVPRATGAVTAWALAPRPGGDHRLSMRARDRAAIRRRSSPLVKPRPLSTCVRSRRKAAAWLVADMASKTVRKRTQGKSCNAIMSFIMHTLTPLSSG